MAFKFIKLFGLALSAPLLSVCAHAPQPLLPVSSNFATVLEKTGVPQLCPRTGKSQSIYPGKGGDTVLLKRGRSTFIYDEGDQDTGETLKTHDRLIIENASSDKFDVDRKDHSLLLCAPNYGYAITILRQYCRGETDNGVWNNAIEEITFASGETWLSDALYDQIDKKAPRDRAFMEANGLYAKYATADTDWQLHKLSDKIPSAGNFRKFCAADQELN